MGDDRSDLEIVRGFRVICHDCPAVAEVTHVERDMNADRILVGAKCHGVVFVFRMDGEAVMAARHRSSITLQDQRQLGTSGLAERVSEIESNMGEALRRACFYHDVLRASGWVPENAAGRRQHYIELAEQLMNYAEVYK